MEGTGWQVSGMGDLRCDTNSDTDDLGRVVGFLAARAVVITCAFARGDIMDCAGDGRQKARGSGGGGGTHFESFRVLRYDVMRFDGGSAFGWVSRLRLVSVPIQYKQMVLFGPW